MSLTYCMALEHVNHDIKFLIQLYDTHCRSDSFSVSLINFIALSQRIRRESNGYYSISSP